MKFKPNKMRYGQDHSQHIGIPTGVEFYVEPFTETMYKLTGPGYGSFSAGYGNGALYVWGLTSRQRSRFEAAIEQQRLAKGGER